MPRNPWPAPSLPRLEIAIHAVQIFLAFLGLCCTASLAAFQSKWHIGVSGLTGFLLFLWIILFLIPLALALPPLLATHVQALECAATFVREPRVRWVVGGMGTGACLVGAIAVSASVFSQPGCQDPVKDPHARLGVGFRQGLETWCTTKKASAAFLWMLFFVWLGFLAKIAWESYKARSQRPARYISHAKESSSPADEASVPMHSSSALLAQEPCTEHIQSSLSNDVSPRLRPPTRGHGWHSVPIKDTDTPGLSYTPIVFIDTPTHAVLPAATPRPAFRIPSHSFSHLTSTRHTPTSPPPPTHIGSPARINSPSTVPHQPGISRTMILATTSASDDPYARSRVAMGLY
ncbi:hypothetical protein NliqN6_4460 [Naganishia liquefaciens]|uniref:Uncharacterized protein n=1 Tax=Naganishia liquefaciens TaxID=104408 RepID=A0A8H3YG95_9TREE|nr:hypothetical protein NliqN6_4460 [Naganishia liquefaciens]